MAKKIKAIFIFEMMGKPPEYLKETLEKYVKSLEIEGVKLLNHKISEAKEIETKKGEKGFLYSTFAEVELEVDNINLLFGIVFRMLPSHVEVIEPADFNLRNFDLSAIMSDLAIKLHKFDEVVKVLMMERDNFANQLNQIRTGHSDGFRVQEVKNEETKREEDKSVDNKVNKKRNKKKK